MTREEIKNLLPVMQAFADGKEIQYVNSEGRVLDKETMFDDISYAFRYRIKPEPTYRPFRNTEECWAEMQKHSPFGWVKKDEYYFQITSITYAKPFKRVDVLIDEAVCPSEYYFNEGWTFVDGTPFGIKEENNNK